MTSYGLRHRFGVTLIVSRHSERWQEFCVRKTGNGTVTQSEESMILMTSYRFPPTVTDPSRSLRMTSYGLRHRFGVTLIVSRHSERWQECCSKKTGNGTVTQSEESMTLMTSYRLPHYGNRSFTFASDDV